MGIVHQLSYPHTSLPGLGRCAAALHPAAGLFGLDLHRRSELLSWAGRVSGKSCVEDGILIMCIHIYI